MLALQSLKPTIPLRMHVDDGCCCSGAGNTSTSDTPIHLSLSLSLSLSRCLLVQCLSVPSVRLSSCPSYPIWTTWQLPVSATYRFHCQLRGRAGISCDRLPSDRPQQSPLGLPSLQKQQNNWYRGRSWRCPISHTAYTCYDFFLTEVNWSGPGYPYYLRWPCSRDMPARPHKIPKLQL